MIPVSGGNGDDDEEDDPDGPSVGDTIAWLDGVLPLLTFVVEREDNQILVVVLMMVLTVRGAAGVIASRRHS